MALSRLDFDPFAGVERVFVVFYFECQFTVEAIEKLPRMDVMVADFAGARRHSFFDDAEIGLFD